MSRENPETKGGRRIGRFIKLSMTSLPGKECLAKK